MPADAPEWLAKTDQVYVRIMVLAPGESTPWHFHSEMTDNVFCLEGCIQVLVRQPGQEIVTLTRGQRRRIPPHQPHCVANAGAQPARYLLVQATGRYDFNRAE